jgi:hypothetical protein
MDISKNDVLASLGLGATDSIGNGRIWAQKETSQQIDTKTKTNTNIQGQDINFSILRCLVFILHGLRTSSTFWKDLRLMVQGWGPVMEGVNSPPMRLSSVAQCGSNKAPSTSPETSP